MAIAPERTTIGIRRHFTTDGVDPYDGVTWERRDARITNYKDGAVAFEQLGVEVPSSWSVNATNILAQKYFRGTLGTEEREWSLKQVTDRVVNTIANWGITDGYFADQAEAEAFQSELKHLIINQKAAFNSPVWFNIGVQGVPQQASACQPYDSLVSTPSGLVPIGKLVEDNAVGAKVMDPNGVTRIVAVKHNGRKNVLRVHLKSGYTLDVTADHLVWRCSDDRYGKFVAAGELKAGDTLQWHRTYSYGEREIDSQEIAEAALAGQRTRGVEMAAPTSMFDAPLPVVAAYLRSIFQAEGYVSLRDRAASIGLDMISEQLIRDVQKLLLRFGIFSRVRFKGDARADRKGCWSLSIRPLGDRQAFAEEIGFIDPRKADKLAQSFDIPGFAQAATKRLEIDRIEDLGEMDVYDIQTESGEYLSGNIRVHNCFILKVDDSMSSILNWYVEEGTIFKGGSGAGTNLSKIRSSKEHLKGGGTASGPVSFMRGADASAGTIKSGGKTRRAAKMVILDIDHPDVRDFIWCKAIEERKARVLRENGFDMDLDGKDSHSIQYQNANNSVRVTDEFMQAVLDDADWHLRAVKDGTPVHTMKAQDLFRELAEATWECADPGMQFDTTINRWHTAANTDRINASNPCFPAGELVHTNKGLIPIEEMISRAADGEEFKVWTHDITNPETPAQEVLLTDPAAYMITGKQSIMRLRFSNGAEIRCTPGHRIFTTNRGYVEAENLTSADRVRTLDLPTPANDADWALPVPANAGSYAEKGDSKEPLELPEAWSSEFAHYLGWLVGDGSTSGSTTSTIYGSADDRTEILPRHAELLEAINCGRPIKISEQPNGTAQLRLSRRRFKRFLEALGVRSVTGEFKEVPWSIQQSPPDIAAAFLRGLFDADGCVRVDRQKGSYVGLGSISMPLLQGVQQLLSTFGIASTIYDAHRGGDALLPGSDRTPTSYLRKPSYDLRISSGSIKRFMSQIGFELSAKQDKLISLQASGHYDVDTSVQVVAKIDEGIETTYNLTEPRNHSYVVGGIVVRNCSEYMHIDNSACNLASLNLLKFLNDDGSFDVVGFRAAVEVVFTAQEILVGNADYPTEAIGENSRRFRQLGLGYANLGALLMAQGLPYDSDEGRAQAGAITALMTGHAYATSARTAARMGPFAGYTENKEHMQRVLEMHQEEVAKIDESLVARELLEAAKDSWTEAVDMGARFGVRNSQASVLAPTGTIGLLMDCDTTGIEPDLGLVKMKKLVGGGNMSIVNQTVPRALRRLGYDEQQINDIVVYIDEQKSILGAPHLAAEHVPVFACSMGDNAIHYSGHVKMMAAAQPFISGAISKCVTGETLIPTADGLVRIGKLYRGEVADSFRDEVLEVASLNGPQKTDAFYYGGERPVREVVLRSGHRVVGTPNHRVLVATDEGFDWRRLDEIKLDDYIATQYGDDLWSPIPARFDDFVASPSYGGQKKIRIPDEMSSDLAFLLGAYVAEGHTTRSNYSIVITNSVESVLARVVRAWQDVFGISARVDRQEGKCPGVVVSSKTLVEFFEYLGAGARASQKRIPDAVLQSPREMVLAFLQGLFLDAYATVSTTPKVGICVDSPGLLDDLQAILTNLDVVHSRIRRYNPSYAKWFEEVYACGEHAQRLIELVPFIEPEKRERATALSALRFTGRHNTGDVIPGLSPRRLYDMLPRGRSGRNGFGLRAEFAFLCDDRTKVVTRRTLERAATAGADLDPWLLSILYDNLHFSPVKHVDDAGTRPVYDISVPTTHAFVGNGIVNHNTVNMPEDVTVEDVEQLHIDAWRMGIKAIAIYRDNCKVAQPLAMAKKEAKEKAEEVVSELQSRDPQLAKKVEELEKALEIQTVVVKEPVRERLPRRRKSHTFAFRVADCEGYVTVGEYDDGRPGEVFMKVSKQGSTLAGIMDAFSISVSIGLQYGVPLETLVKKYTNMRFEPSGMTDDPELRIASSLVDYIFRRLAVDYLPAEKRRELGIETVAERTQPTLPGVEEESTPSASLNDAPVAPTAPQKPQPVAHADAPLCMQCGIQMQRAGSCHACPSCGTTSGCS